MELPRTLAQLRRFLHGYRIRAAGDERRICRASAIISHIDKGKTSAGMLRAAQELARLDPDLSWLPAWKPRVSVAVPKGDGA